MPREINDNNDIFFRKKYIFLIQYRLETRVISLIKTKFQVEELMTDKGKILIIEELDEETQ